MTYDSHDRSYLLYRPMGLTAGRPVPLLIMLHGGFGSGEQAESSYSWDRESDRYGFLVVYPNGITHSWNAGDCCGPAARDQVDDVGFP